MRNEKKSPFLKALLLGCAALLASACGKFPTLNSDKSSSVFTREILIMYNTLNSQFFLDLLSATDGSATAPASNALGSLGTMSINPYDEQVQLTTTNAKYLLVSDASWGLYSFNIDPITGQLSNAPGSPSHVANPTYDFPSTEPKKRWVYLASGANSQIFGFNLDPSTGAISPTTWSPKVIAETFLNAASGYQTIVFDSAGSYAYAAVNNGGSYQINAYSINQTTGDLTALATPSYAVPVSIDDFFVDPSMHFIFVLHMGSQLRVYRINGDGSLTGTSTAAYGSDGDGKHFFDLTGKHLYVSQSGSFPHTAYHFTFDTTTGVLTGVGNVTGIGDISLNGIDSKGQFVCLANGATGDFGLGKMDPVTHDIATPVNFVNDSATHCSFSRNGKYVYAIPYGGGVTTGFVLAYDSATGAVTAAGTYPTGGFMFGGPLTVGAGP